MKRALTHGSLLAVLMTSAALPGVDTVDGWQVTSYAGWPGVGASAAMFMISGTSGRWASVAAQTVAITTVLALTHEVTWWQGAAASLAVTLPGMLAARWLQPDTAASRRFNEGEVDAYHGVTATAGLVCAALSAAVAAAAGPSGLTHVLLTGLVSFFAATTAQLVLLPFWLRRAGGWRRLGHSLELWAQRAMLVVFLAAVFVPHAPLPTAFLFFPVIGWAAIRATVPETHLQVLVVSAVALVATLSGRGPLALDSIKDPNPLAPLLVYMFIASVCYLLVPLALTVERLTWVTRQATGAATTVRRMLDSATGTVFIATDAAGGITHYNHGAEQALGFTAEEVLGRPTSLFHTRTEVERQAASFGLAGLPPARLYPAVVSAQSESGLRRDWEFRRKDGEHRTVSLNVSKLTDPGGSVVAYIASGEDITERIRAQRALEKAYEQEHASAEALRAADDVKQELVSTVSHELRTPITNITGYAELLADGDLGDLTDRQLEAVDRIERNSARLHQLVDDLLTLSSAESDALQIVKTPVDLNAVAVCTHEMLTPQTAGRRLQVDLTLASRPVLVLGDQELLERALTNLWSNAIKFTPDGGTIRLVVEEPHTAATHGSVTVCDTGMGIPADEQADVFTRFYRTAAAGERAIQGSGLGLSIVRAIVDQHDGEIALESAPGNGTTVRVAIPRTGSLSVVGAPDPRAQDQGAQSSDWTPASS